MAFAIKRFGMLPITGFMRNFLFGKRIIFARDICELVYGFTRNSTIVFRTKFVFVSHRSLFMIIHQCGFCCILYDYQNYGVDLLYRLTYYRRN